MTSRSIVLGAAALLLFSAAATEPFGFQATAVFAQGMSAKVAEALSGNPAQLDARQLREAINVLRDAVESRALRGADRKAAQDKIKAYEKALKQGGERQQAEQAETGQQQRAQGQQAERKAEQQARKAEQQARKAERKSEQQVQVQVQQVQPQQPARRAQAQQQAQQQAQTQQQPQTQQRTQRQQSPQTALSPAMAAALGDTRPSSALEPAELRNRIQTLTEAVQSGALSRDQRRQAVERLTADSQALQTRQTTQAPVKQAPVQQAEAPKATEAPAADVRRRARAIIADQKPADNLGEEDLRKRLNESRAVLGTDKLSREEERELRRQLSRDRDELRRRVARRQEEPRSLDSRSQGRTGTQAVTGSQITTTTNVTVILERRTPSERLSDRDLEERVRILSKALKEEKIARRDLEIALRIVEQDRRELRRRLHAGRDYRREERRRARSRNEIFIDFNIGYRPPPVIFAAEAMPRDIEIQLIAPPLRQVSRAYTFQEIYTNHDVREMMPGIEIDTLNFDFGSAEVRPEEIDKLDAIAEVIERIVAVRPDEVFALEGNTDAVGSHEANDALSLRRARAVADALIDYYDIDPANLRTVGLGKRFLKIMTPDPEEENRRVTVRRITPLLVGRR